jgi:hypothetical protein
MLIHRLFLTQRFLFLFGFFENAKAFYLARACVLLIRFSGRRVKSLRLKYFQTFIKILCVKIIPKYLENTKHI